MTLFVPHWHGSARTRFTRRIALAGLAAWGVLAARHASAQVTVNPAISTAAGVSTFDYTIDNGTANDLAIVSIAVPALPGAVFDLVTPAGFLASFDSGTGFVDFLADSSSFSAGSSLSGFKYSSTFEPGQSTFSALDVLGSPFSGPTVAAAVPEPGAAAWLGLLGLTGLTGIARALTPRRRSTHAVLQEENAL